MEVLVVNGPNLNRLGERELDVYGDVTLADLELKIAGWAQRMGVTVECRQTNSEAELLSWLHTSSHNGLILNPGAFTHTSRALADAVASIEVPVVETHISNVRQRETWRSLSVLENVVDWTIYGRGLEGYRDALRFLVNRHTSPSQALRYGPHPLQTGELRGNGAKLAIVIHGGVWRGEYRRDTTESISGDLAAAGFTSWNIGYRLLDEGGGWPSSAHDVEMALRLATASWGLGWDRVTLVGHSAGAYLGMWAASRNSELVEQVLALAPISDLSASVARADVCAPQCAVMLDMGAPSPLALPSTPTTVVHGTGDQVVTIEDSEKLTRGTDADLVSGPFGHFDLLNPDSDAWKRAKDRIA